MSRDFLLLFLRKELSDLRSNKQVWPAYFLLPMIAILLPLLLLAVLPGITGSAELQNDAGVRMLLESVSNDPTLRGANLEERLARFLLRDLALFYLFMPVVLSANAAALALVREKEQRTLEPILATPLRDRDLLLAKLLAALVPSVAITWGAAILGFAVGALGSRIVLQSMIFPTLGNLVAVFLLAPAMATASALAGLRVSARFTDVPGATQFTGLVIVPVGLVVVAVMGRPAMLSALAGVALTLLFVLVSLALFGQNVRRFRREELLTKWR